MTSVHRISTRLQKKPWRHYRPDWRVVSAAGGSTQPSRISDREAFKNIAGRWTQLSSGLVVVQQQANFPFGGTFGVGDAYAFGLPRPVERDYGADHLEGTGMAYQALSDPSRNMPVQPKLVERGQFADLARSAEDHYMVLQFPYFEEGGTATLDGALTVVSHTCPWTPLVQEIRVTPTTTTDSGNTQAFPIGVTSVTSSQFSIALRAGTGVGTDIGCSWRLRATPNGGINSLVGPKKPWTWVTFWKIFSQFTYYGR